jgi:hypothetical protein
VSDTGFGLNRAVALIDEVLPHYDAHEVHSIAEALPGTVRVVANFLSDGERLSTETRIEAVDDAARRAFLRYWRVVGPFSAVIRRRWLKQIAR